jgi:hypothetical protein
MSSRGTSPESPLAAKEAKRQKRTHSVGFEFEERVLDIMLQTLEETRAIRRMMETRS